MDPARGMTKQRIVHFLECLPNIIQKCSLITWIANILEVTDELLEYEIWIHTTKNEGISLELHRIELSKTLDECMILWENRNNRMLDEIHQIEISETIGDACIIASERVWIKSLWESDIQERRSIREEFFDLWISNIKENESSCRSIYSEFSHECCSILILYSLNFWHKNMYMCMTLNLW